MAIGGFRPMPRVEQILADIRAGRFTEGYDTIWIGRTAWQWLNAHYGFNGPGREFKIPTVYLQNRRAEAWVDLSAPTFSTVTIALDPEVPDGWYRIADA